MYITLLGLPSFQPSDFYEWRYQGIFRIMLTGPETRGSVWSTFVMDPWAYFGWDALGGTGSKGCDIFVNCASLTGLVVKPAATTMAQ